MTSGCSRRTRERRVAGRAELANGENLQRRPQRAGDLTTDRDAATRKRDDDEILASEGRRLTGEEAPRLLSVRIAHISILGNVRVARIGWMHVLVCGFPAGGR